MQELDELEDQGTQLINEFKPLAAAPESPHEIEELVQIYEDDAKKCAELASSLSQHAARVDAQRVPLLKLQEDGVTLEVVKVRVKTLADRLEELETAAERARKRAEGDAKEIDALNQKKARLEGGVGRKGTNEGPDK
jgi:methyl-accepting chemotaxis protein